MKLLVFGDPRLQQELATAKEEKRVAEEKALAAAQGPVVMTTKLAKKTEVR